MKAIIFLLSLSFYEYYCAKDYSFVQGWYKDRKVYFLDYGTNYEVNSNGITLNSIYVFITGHDVNQNPILVPGQFNVIGKIPGDFGYSNLFRITYVMVDSNYQANTVTDEQTILSTYGNNLIVSGTIVNYHVIETGSVLLGVDGPTTPISTPTTPIDPDLLSLGYTETAELIPTPNKVRLFWKPPTDTKTLQLAARGYGIGGFIGVGFTFPNADIKTSNAMIGSDAVIGWIDGSGTGNIQPYFLGGKAENLVTVSTKLTISNASVTEDSTSTTLFFTRPFDSGTNPLDATSSNNIISSFSYTDGPPHFHDAFSPSVVSINFQTGESIVLPPSAALSNRDIHGILMMISWGIILLFGVLFARYSKRLPNALWFNIHQTAQPLGYLLALSGFILAFIMVDGVLIEPISVAHGTIGIVLMSLGFVQILSGIFRPHLKESEEKTKARKIFEIFHPTNGCLICILVIIQIYLGIKIVGWSIGVFIGYAVYLFLIFSFIVYAEITGKFKPAKSNL